MNSPTAPPPALPDRTTIAPPRRRRLRTVLLAGGCLLAGVAGGVGARQALGHRDEALATEPHHHSVSHAPLLPDPEFHPADTDADAAIRSGDFARGLLLCREARKAPPGNDDRQLAYREGLCLEGLRRWEEAGEAYRRAADPNTDVATWAWGSLGQARCAAATGNLETARGLLNQVVLRSGDPAIRRRELLEECYFLRGRLAVLALHPSVAPDPLDPNDLAWPRGDNIEPAIDRLLGNGEPHSPEPPHPVEPRPVEVAKGDKPPERFEVSGRVPSASVADLLKSLASAAGLTVRVEPDAAKRLVDRSAAIDVDRAMLGEVLAALLEPAGLAWRLDDGRLVVSVAPKDDRAANREVATRVLRAAVAAVPTHPAARTVEIWLANLEHGAGRWRQAGTNYRRLLDTAPHAAEAVYAAYNLGLVELRIGNLPQARGRFMGVVDRHPGTRWAEIGWWWVGRTHLDAADPGAALGPFRSALAGSSREVSSAAVLGICACHILDGDEAAARLVLRDHRINPGGPHATTAAMFHALLRYRVAPTEGRRDVAEGAIRAARGGEALGPAGFYIAGQLYREIGLPGRMVELCDAAGEKARGPFGIRMTFAAAERLHDLDLRAEARQRYLAVAAADPDGLGPRAELRVAEMAAHDGKGAECVRRCRGLLDRPGVNRDEVLAVMGRGYELQGRFRLAAEAFAGRVPVE